MKLHARSRMMTIATAAALALATLGWSGPARAQGPEIWFGDVQRSGLDALLVGGDYSWWLEVDAPRPATMHGVPAALLQQVGARTIDVRFDWGDGSTPTTFTSDANFDATPYSMGCNNEYTVDGTTDPPTYYPQDDFGYNCWANAPHRYLAQGIYTVTITAEQDTDEGVATGTTSRTDVVVDTRLAASLSGKGTVDAPAGSGGMYDQDYVGGPVSFTVTAKRAARSAGTKASVTVSAPNMTPDYPSGDPASGMTFTGSAAMQPLYVAKTRTGGEAFLMRVEGTVTNSRGYAGGAWAIVHAKVEKGSPTLVRIVVHNTSAGYTYLDTGWNPSDWFSLDPAHDLLTSGMVKIG
ncbi:MAG TPA: hypothetical protein VHO29_19570 [Marmoricola sp.]|nr:hypothetical protein [Marmoricola sp.]